MNSSDFNELSWECSNLESALSKVGMSEFEVVMLNKSFIDKYQEKDEIMDYEGMLIDYHIHLQEKYYSLTGSDYY